jgi:hypothetical protein
LHCWLGNHEKAINFALLFLENGAERLDYPLLNRAFYEINKQFTLSLLAEFPTGQIV